LFVLMGAFVGITFHDGSPLTVHDVAFSLQVLKDKGHPIAQQLLRDLVGAEARDDATALVRFAPSRARGRAGLVAPTLRCMMCSISKSHLTAMKPSM
jgi:hypothetical protein